jgi:hypothetical protein
MNQILDDPASCSPPGKRTTWVGEGGFSTSSNHSGDSHTRLPQTGNGTSRSCPTAPARSARPYCHELLQRPGPRLLPQESLGRMPDERPVACGASHCRSRPAIGGQAPGLNAYFPTERQRPPELSHINGISSHPETNRPANASVEASASRRITSSRRWYPRRSFSSSSVPGPCSVFPDRCSHRLPGSWPANQR